MCRYVHLPGVRHLWPRKDQVCWPSSASDWTTLCQGGHPLYQFGDKKPNFLGGFFSTFLQFPTLFLLGSSPSFWTLLSASSRALSIRSFLYCLSIPLGTRFLLIRSGHAQNPIHSEWELGRAPPSLFPLGATCPSFLARLLERHACLLSAYFLFELQVCPICFPPLRSEISHSKVIGLPNPIPVDQFPTLPYLSFLCFVFLFCFLLIFLSLWGFLLPDP